MSLADGLDPRSLPEVLQHLAGQLADPAATARASASRPARPGARKAAVLVMLGEQGRDVTFTERAAHMRTHAGQVSFPGGSLEVGETPVQAALREAHEEIGIDPSRVTVLGQLPPAHVAASGFDVAGIVGLWDGADDLLAVDANEVAAIHRFGVRVLADPAHRVTWRLPSGHEGPAFVVDDVFVWGFTAHLVDCLLDLGGWSVPWDRDDVRTVPPRFLRR